MGLDQTVGWVMTKFILSDGADYFPGIEQDNSGNDLIRGLVGDDTIQAGDGHDTVYGGAGNDSIGEVFFIDGDGNDRIYGGLGDDTLDAAFSQDRVWGGAGNDLVSMYRFPADAGWTSSLYGGEGNDSLIVGTLSDQPAHVTVTRTGDLLHIEFAGQGSLDAHGFEQLEVELTGQPFDFQGCSLAEAVSGQVGRGTMRLGGGDDSAGLNIGLIGSWAIDGGKGHDLLVIDPFAASTDFLEVHQTRAGGVVSANGLVQGTYTDFETVHFKGSNGADLFHMGASDDDIVGWGGNDSFFGGQGDDTLISGGGDCILTGGQGRDRLFGGSGSDHFIYNAVRDSGYGASDQISNFSVGRDVIDLSRIESGAADGAFTYIGASAFTAAGQVRAVESGGWTYVLINTDGTTTAEMEIRMAGVVAANLSATDFVL